MFSMPRIKISERRALTLLAAFLHPPFLPFSPFCCLALPLFPPFRFNQLPFTLSLSPFSIHASSGRLFLHALRNPFLPFFFFFLFLFGGRTTRREQLNSPGRSSGEFSRNDTTYFFSHTVYQPTSANAAASPRRGVAFSRSRASRRV